jgi:hypothetical protein
MKNKETFITSPKSGDKSKKNSDELVTVVLLSENHGHRMKSYGPISLIKLENKTILEKQIDAIKACFKNFEIIICSGFETEKVVNFVKSKFSNLNIRIVENQIYYHSNCCESARLCLSNTVNTKILFCSGGILLNQNHLNLIDLNQTCILGQYNNSDSNFEIGIIENNNRLESFALGIKDKFWSEIFYINSQKHIDALFSILCLPDYKNKFIFEAINEINKSINIGVIFNQKISPKIDNIKTLKRITQ